MLETIEKHGRFLKMLKKSTLARNEEYLFSVVEESCLNSSIKFNCVYSLSYFFIKLNFWFDG